MRENRVYHEVLSDRRRQNLSGVDAAGPRLWPLQLSCEQIAASEIVDRHEDTLHGARRKCRSRGRKGKR
jgi:hypothetical protein